MGGFFCVLFLLLSAVRPVHGEELELYATAAVLMDADSGRVLYGKNEDAVMAMASTTKIMTCIVVLETVSQDDILTVSAYAASMPKVKLYIQKGEQYTVRDLLHSLMLESHNDAAVALAEYVGKQFLPRELQEKDTSEYTAEESKMAMAAFAAQMNRKAAELMRAALKSAGLPEDCVSLVQDTSHETANELMHLDGYVDVLIPRGGAGLIRAVAKEAGVPVIRTGEGVCHIYVDSEADLDMGAEILYNAKCSRPSVCNAAECLLVQEDVAEAFLKKAVPLLDRNRVELRCDERALAVLGDRAVPAADSDWDAEYDDYILAVRTVKDMEEAVEFINAHGTGHSEAIITTNYFKAQRFLDTVDAAAVYVNASTRFTDGGEFGLGAEIGISTQKMHARGPMGLEELTSCKYVIYGEGQVR